MCPAGLVHKSKIYTTSAKSILNNVPLRKASGIAYFDFFFNEPPTTEIYTSLHTLSLHDALPISLIAAGRLAVLEGGAVLDVLHAFEARSEEHTSELQSRNDISYAVFCLKKK